MYLCNPSRLRAVLTGLVSVFFSAPLALAGSVSITSPAANSANPGAVLISASASENQSFHLELWDNGSKLGDVFSSSVSATYPLAQGAHVTTVLAVSNNGVVLNSSVVGYNVVPAASAASNGNLSISSPTPGSTSSSAVRITASVNQPATDHLEVWDNGYKLGNIPGSSVNDVYVLPNGPHVLTVQAISATGGILSKNNVDYQVAENCNSSNSVQCDLDQQPTDNSQGVCNPAEEPMWVANTCGSGVQGNGGSYPSNTGLQVLSAYGPLPNLDNLSLNGHALHLSEVQGNGGFSNALFRGQSPTLTSTNSTDTNWVLDEYVHLPDPTAHQAFEMDAQASINGIWTKFYTECAFNMNAGTGYWAVFDSNTGGWLFLNGQTQNGQATPTVPCNRSQFMGRWSGSSDDTFTGWHHIAWSFLRNSDGTVTYQSITFDGTTTQLNFRPNSGSGGSVNNNGKFSALIQLDGVGNQDGRHPSVDAYVNEVTLTHTP